MSSNKEIIKTGLKMMEETRGFTISLEVWTIGRNPFGFSTDKWQSFWAPIENETPGDESDNNLLVFPFGPLESLTSGQIDR